MKADLVKIASVVGRTLLALPTVVEAAKPILDDIKSLKKGASTNAVQAEGEDYEGRLHGRDR